MMPALLALLLTLLVAAAGPVSAQSRLSPTESFSTGTFITPFPENDTYRVQVYGEGVAEGLLYGLIEAMGKEQKVVIARKIRTVSGLLRNEIADELRAIESEIERDAPHVAIVMPNMLYRLPWREGFDRRFPPGSEARREEIQRRREVWKAERGQKFDQFVRALRRRNTAVYLVGQPIMRNTFTTDDAQVINELIRERALLNGAKYIDIYAAFADESGAYDSQGPDIDGKPRTLRDQEGVSFTSAGFRKLGYFVEREIKRDLALARAERTVPLAGSEDEQRKIRPKAPPPSATVKGGAVTAGKDGKPIAASPQAVPPPSPGQWATRADVAVGEDVRAENSRINLKTINLQGREDTLTIEIVRPSIPASLLAAVTRRESADKPSQVGDAVVSELAGGQTIINSVTPFADGAVGDRKRSATGGNLPYQLVLEKGQRLTPKPGRSDDMPWPRVEVLPAAAAAAATPAGGVRRPAGATPKSPATNFSPAQKEPSPRG